MSSIKDRHCRNCGGEIGENNICKYCHSKENIDFEISKLIFPFNVEDYYNNIIRKKIESATKLDEKEDKVFKLLLDNNVIKDDSLDDLKVLESILRGNKIISYDTFESLIKRSTEKNMRQLNNGKIKNYFPYAEITNLDGCNGSAFSYTSVKFDIEIIKRMYNGYIESFITYYHEVNHTAQALAIEQGYITYDLINVIKEKIIRKVELLDQKTDDYYKDNYYNITFEIDSEYVGIASAFNLLVNVLKFEVPKEFFESKKRTLGNVRNEDRIVRENGEKKIRKLDEIFFEVLKKHPEFLTKYPQLQIEYVNEEGLIRKRTMDELSDILMDNLNNKTMCEYIELLIHNMNKEKEKK